jgi:hypothetical protein
LLQYINKAAPLLEELSLYSWYQLQAPHTTNKAPPVFPSLVKLSMSDVSLVMLPGVVLEEAE